jgi:predicted O-methyltransferase YrrM
MSKESMFTTNNPLCQDIELWQTRDEQSAEEEVSEFIFGLVRLLKPKICVETGCYLGDTTVKIAEALWKNGRGKLFACDTESAKIAFVKDVLHEKGLNPQCLLFNDKGIDMIKGLGKNMLIDFAFIDSGDAEVRREEIEEVMKYMPAFGVIVLHDTAPQHRDNSFMAGQIKLPAIYLNCPRGLSVFIKTDL